MQIRILSMTAQNGGTEILLRVELSEDVFDVVGGSVDLRRAPEREVRELLLLADSYMELRPTKGVIDEGFFRSLEWAAELASAVRTGLKMLSYGANTQRGLTLKLCRKGSEREIAEEAVAYLAARGYISEEGDAVREAERNVAKLRGRNRIRAVLREKGYGDEAIEAAERYLDGVDFVEICRTLIEKRYAAVLIDPQTRKKAVASLMRNGFTMQEIRAAARGLS